MAVNMFNYHPKYLELCSKDGIDIDPPNAKILERQKKGHSVTSLKELTEHLDVSPDKAKRGSISGKRGDIVFSGDRWSISTSPRSKRHASGISRRLGFMEPVEITDSRCQFRLDRMPTSSEAEVIREIVGLNKRPELTPEQRETRQNHLASVRRGSKTQNAPQNP
jgi:hypothetical protein